MYKCADYRAKKKKSQHRSARFLKPWDLTLLAAIRTYSILDTVRFAETIEIQRSEQQKGKKKTFNICPAKCPFSITVY
jgi:hypothetical protein